MAIWFRVWTERLLIGWTKSASDPQVGLFGREIIERV